jgi:hypothetical protein
MQDHAKEIYDFVKKSASYESDRASLLLLLNQFKVLAPTAQHNASLATKLRDEIIPARTLELVSLSGNSGLRYEVDG